MKLIFSVLNAMYSGSTPQNRERIYILGFRDKDEYSKFNFPLTIELTTKLTYTYSYTI